MWSLAKHQCASCFEKEDKRGGGSFVSPAEGARPGSDSGSGSGSRSGCGHHFCGPCLTRYVRGAVREGQLPVRCPMSPGPHGCGAMLSRQQVLVALGTNASDLRAFGLLEAESTIAPEHKRYCPHPGCSSPLVLERVEDVPPDAPTECPACHRAFCPRCMSPGWHQADSEQAPYLDPTYRQGDTCAEYQRLPADERAPDTAALLRLAAERGWRRCPRCRVVIEKVGGCSHMTCRCKAAFTYFSS
ncbi:hypothetical protein GPECTOR_26g473 [Gonium pectorale]|uniref:RBR-type E3 ubiquitin transferase n=1 Tax=Gonium pectorale TaxID=33097 RepID=A0A150GGS6_GONPE|nr:hypothetical protein GPECTOR_26g473 [Gonium pectorale]|eukprot:KXZ48570.1 hypothetical protein GPECTOR_26g473 [Gonium pectorale]